MDDVISPGIEGNRQHGTGIGQKAFRNNLPCYRHFKVRNQKGRPSSDQEEAEAVDIIRKATNTVKPEESVERVLELFAKTRTNKKFVEMAKKTRF